MRSDSAQKTVKQVRDEARPTLVQALRDLSDKMQDAWYIAQAEQLREMAMRIELDRA